jgi:hypothetical protein
MISATLCHLVFASETDDEQEVLWAGTLSARYAKTLLGTDKYFCTYHEKWGTSVKDNCSYGNAMFNVILRESRDQGEPYSNLELVSGTVEWNARYKISDSVSGCGGVGFQRGRGKKTGTFETEDMKARGWIREKEGTDGIYYLVVGIDQVPHQVMIVEYFNHLTTRRVHRTKREWHPAIHSVSLGAPRSPRMHPYDPNDEHLDTIVSGPLELKSNGALMEGSYNDAVVKTYPTRRGQTNECEGIAIQWNLQKVGKDKDLITLTECDYNWEPKAEEDEVVMFTVNIFQPEYSLVEKIEFRLEETSKEPGRYMNDYEKADDESYDLSFESERNPFYKITEEGQVATRTDPIYKAYDSIIVTCYDYGARAKLRATVTLKGIGDREAVSSKDDSRKYVTIPYDYSGGAQNGIADWMAQDSDGAKPETDEDAEPQGRGVPGDGFAIYEEYRGFYVKGEHKRTDVDKKTMFVASDLTEGIGYATRLPYEVVEIDASEFREEDRMMNGCHSDFGHFVDQKALHVECATIVKPGYGHCEGNEECPAGSCPYHNEYTCVDIVKIRTAAGPIDSASVTDPVDTECIKKTIAHVVGRAIGMWMAGEYAGKYEEPAGDGSTTYMVAGFPWLFDEKIKPPTGYGDHNIAQSDLLCAESEGEGGEE